MFSARLARERGAIPFEVCSNRDKIRGKKTPSFSLSPSIHPSIYRKKERDREEVSGNPGQILLCPLSLSHFPSL